MPVKRRSVIEQKTTCQLFGNIIEMNELENLDLKKGFSFNFENSGNEITLKCSPFSGLEEVFVNDKLVTSKKTYSKNSTHTFEIGESSFSIDLITVSLLKGPIICTLNKNGLPQKRKQIVFKIPETNTDDIKFEPKNDYRKYILCAIIVVIYVAAKIYWELPIESIFFLMGALFISYILIEFIDNYREMEDPIITMEEVEIK